MKPKSKILIIAGSDSSGGAGIQADIKTVTSLGSYAMTAITAITSQNTTGVFSVLPINPKEIEKSINNIPGVLENGLFIDLTDKLLVGKIENGVPVVYSPSKVG